MGRTDIHRWTHINTDRHIHAHRDVPDMCTSTDTNANIHPSGAEWVGGPWRVRGGGFLLSRSPAEITEAGQFRSPHP